MKTPRVEIFKSHLRLEYDSNSSSLHRDPMRQLSACAKSVLLAREIRVKESTSLFPLLLSRYYILWETKEMKRQRNAQTVTGKGVYSKRGTLISPSWSYLSLILSKAQTKKNNAFFLTPNVTDPKGRENKDKAENDTVLKGCTNNLLTWMSLRIQGGWKMSPASSTCFWIMDSSSG